MDFHGLARKDLQALCKKNKIPANMTNVAMADALTALENVEGLDEFLNSSNSDLSNPAGETLIGSPDIPRTACRNSTRRKPIKEESESTQPLARTRRGTRGRTGEEVDQENNDVNVLVTPAAPSGRRRAPAASTRRNIEAQMKQDEEDEKNEAQGRSAVPSSRGRAPVASARKKLDIQKEENSIQRVYSTRRSVRLLEKTMASLSMMESGNAEPVKMYDLSEEMSNGLEISEVSTEVKKNIHGSEAVSELDSQKADVPEVLEVAVGDKDQKDDGDEVSVLKSEESVGSEISDGLAGAEVPKAVDEGHCEGSEKSDIISSEKLEKDIDVDDETLEKGQDDVLVTPQDTVSDLSTDIKEDHVVSSFHVQDLASKDSDMNDVEGGEDLGGHDSESEYTTEGESDEDEVTDSNSYESEENNSDDDSETEEKESDALVLPENQMIAFEKLENKMEVDIQRSREELVELVTKADASDFDVDATFNDDSGPKVLAAVQSEGEVSLDSAEKESLNDDHVMAPCPVDYMTETECPSSVKKMSASMSDSEVTGLIPSQPFAADQISGQFPRPSIQKITDVSDDDEEDLDNGNGKMELKEEMTRQDENFLKTYTGMSLRQLKKKLKEMQITHSSSKNNRDQSSTKELAGKKRIALQQLPENCMEVDESEKVQ